MRKIPDLEVAFRATTYRVEAGGEVFELRIAEGNPAFAAWLKGQRIRTWGIVTACNPGGRLALDQNAVRTRRLQEKVAGHGWRHAAACNCADAGDWPDEPGFCLFDVEENALRMLAVEFGQSAIMCGSADDGRGEIVWLIVR